MSAYIDLNKHANKILQCKNGILFDTNIWLFLQDMTVTHYGGGYNIESYSSLYKMLLENSIQIYTTKTIISEYINSAIRIDMINYYSEKNINSHTKNYKRDFAKTPGFEDKYQTIIESAKQDILEETKLVGISNTAFEKTLKTCSIQDFNDQVIINTALENNLPILTDDADYIKYAMNNIGNCPTIFSYNKLS